MRMPRVPNLPRELQVQRGLLRISFGHFSLPAWDSTSRSREEHRTVCFQLGLRCMYVRDHIRTYLPTHQKVSSPQIVLLMTNFAHLALPLVPSVEKKCRRLSQSGFMAGSARRTVKLIEQDRGMGSSRTYYCLRMRWELRNWTRFSCDGGTGITALSSSVCSAKWQGCRCSGCISPCGACILACVGPAKNEYHRLQCSGDYIRFVQNCEELPSRSEGQMVQEVDHTEKRGGCPWLSEGGNRCGVSA